MRRFRVRLNQRWRVSWISFMPPLRIRICVRRRVTVLKPPLLGYYSIRVNAQYRLIFQWAKGEAWDLYLDPHRYKK